MKKSIFILIISMFLLSVFSFNTAIANETHAMETVEHEEVINQIKNNIEKYQIAVNKFEKIEALYIQRKFELEHTRDEMSLLELDLFMLQQNFIELQRKNNAITDTIALRNK